MRIIQTTFHTTAQITVPEVVHLLLLPPKSLELQPTERPWLIANEAIANQSFKPLDQLEDRPAHRCRALINQPNFVQGLTTSISGVVL